MPFGRPKKPRAPLNAAGLYNYAVMALGRQMRTEAELRRLMKSRVEPGEVGEAHIEAVLQKLCEQGYLNDAAFAETYARLRREHEKLGQRRVRQNLRQKGVASELIDETLEAGYANTNEETQARAFIEKRRLKKPESEKESVRLMRRLVTAGFSVGVIYKILRQWDVPDELLTELDNLEEPDAEADENPGHEV
jgi:regulatory protein